MKIKRHRLLSSACYLFVARDEILVRLQRPQADKIAIRLRRTKSNTLGPCDLRFLMGQFEAFFQVAKSVDAHDHGNFGMRAARQATLKSRSAHPCGLTCAACWASRSASWRRISLDRISDCCDSM